MLRAAQGSVLFEHSAPFDFQASGPVSLAAGQNASVCATNLDNSPVFILIALLQADNGSLLAVRQEQLQAGGGSCLNFARSVQTPSGNVIGLAARNAHLTELGAIVQDRPGDGCIAASVQIQAAGVNNIPGQTFLYAPMKDFQEN
jgi:hypothetical protein